MFSEKQLQLPTEKQLKLVKALEKQSGLKFYGTTKREVGKFVERANETIKENRILRNMKERQKNKE